MDAFQSIGLLQENQPCRVKRNMYIEYPGYSLHPKSVTSTAYILGDVERLSQWIHENKYKVHIVGQSIGTGPACYLAHLLHKTKLVKSLELITPFVNMYRLAMDRASIFGILVYNYYPNDQYLKEIAGEIGKSKIIIHHGTDDEIIPYSHGVELSNYGTLKTYRDAMHNDILWTRIY
jgi:hypothetical protein